MEDPSCSTFYFLFFQIINTFFSGLDKLNQLHFKLAHSKTKFNVSWLMKRDGNGHMLGWWCNEDEANKFEVIC